MTLTVRIPARPEIHLAHLVLDMNGTLTNRGVLLDGVEDRIANLRSTLEVHLVSADTFGTLEDVAATLQASSHRAGSGEDKLRYLDQLGRERCAVIGNGTNDALVLKAAALGFVVIGPEGASAAAFLAADVVCRSAADAMDLLLDQKALWATLRE